MVDELFVSLAGAAARQARRGLVPLLVATLAVAGTAVQPALAAGSTITVNSIAFTLADDGTCSYIEAIYAANKDMASGALPGECAAGSGADTIVFAPVLAGQSIDLTGGGPAIEGDLTIDGGGDTTLDLGGVGHVDKTSGTVTIKGLTIQHGGNLGVWNRADGLLVLQDTVVTGTTDGAGVFNEGAVRLERTTLAGNTAHPGVNGGGLWNATGAAATVLDSVIRDNYAGSGGGILNEGTLVVQRSLIDHNGGTMDVGGGLDNRAHASISATTFTRNSSGMGGAIWNEADLAVDNSTFVANSASLHDGAAISNAGDLTALNVTISGNLEGPGFAALANSDLGRPNLVLQNSIIAGNQGSDYGGPALPAGSGHNQVGPLPGGVPLSTWLHTTLADNGGPTPTLALVDSAISPFAATGDPAVCAIAPVGAVDQRGVTRPAATCSIGAFQVDRTKPTVTAPVASIRTGTSLSGSAGRVRISWTARDPGGSGIDHATLARSVDGGAWTTVAPSAGSSFDVALTSGRSYRFRVRVVDNDGNVSTWVTGPVVKPALVQQTSTAVHYGGTWTGLTKTDFSGGSERYAKTAGRSASYTASGRAFALITTMGPGRGVARIYVDGKLNKAVDLVAMVPLYRYQAWSIRFAGVGTHTVKVVVVGTAGRPRVDVDAFVVLR